LLPVADRGGRAGQAPGVPESFRAEGGRGRCRPGWCRLAFPRACRQSGHGRRRPVPGRVSGSSPSGCS